jgi:hypothetical protein
MLTQSCKMLDAYLTATVAAGAPICPRCTPEQLLLMVEAATLHGSRGACMIVTANQQRNMHDLAALLSSNEASWAPWLPGSFMRRAVPTLSAYVAAATPQLRPASPAEAAAAAQQGFHLEGMGVQGALLHAVQLLVQLPGGVLQAPQLSSVPLERLLACADAALRTNPPVQLHLGTARGYDILKVGV